MHRRPPEFSRRLRHGLLPAAGLVLAPKCVLCLLAYTGLGLALGLGGPELCGATAGSAAEPAWWPWLGPAGGLAYWLLRPGRAG